MTPAGRLVWLPVAAAFALTGCVDKIARSRVENALVEAGLSQANASCMATRMVDRLTISQLRKLEALRGPRGEPARPATIGQFVDRVRAVDDPEVLSVTLSSAALCATGFG